MSCPGLAQMWAIPRLLNSSSGGHALVVVVVLERKYKGILNKQNCLVT